MSHDPAICAALNAARHAWADSRTLELAAPLIDIVVNRARRIGIGPIDIQTQKLGRAVTFCAHNIHFLFACAIAAGYALRIHDERQTRRIKKAR
jgi:hypothetical protein